MYSQCTSSDRRVFHCIETKEKLSDLKIISLCIPLYLAYTTVIEQLNPSASAILPMISIRKISEVWTQPPNNFNLKIAIVRSNCFLAELANAFWIHILHKKRNLLAGQKFLKTDFSYFHWFSVIVVEIIYFPRFSFGGLIWRTIPAWTLILSKYNYFQWKLYQTEY